MTTRTRTDGAPDLFKVVGTAAWLNFEGAARTVIRGRRGWVGAVNTDYDPLDPRTAAPPHAAYRSIHEKGRVHYNPPRARVGPSPPADGRPKPRPTAHGTP